MNMGVLQLYCIVHGCGCHGIVLHCVWMWLLWSCIALCLDVVTELDGCGCHGIVLHCNNNK